MYISSLLYQLIFEVEMQLGVINDGTIRKNNWFLFNQHRYHRFRV